MTTPLKTGVISRWQRAAYKLITQPIVHLSFWRRFPIQTLRLLIALAQDLWEGELTLIASSLAFTTLLSMVPFLALSFSIFTLLGVHNEMEPVLQHLLAPLGEKSVEFTHQIIDFIENIDVHVLGFLGLGFLLYTALTMANKIEIAFNYIWHVEERRSILRRLSIYISTILVAPVLMFSAIGIIAAIFNRLLLPSLAGFVPLEQTYNVASRIAPLALIVLAFTFTILLIPNARVRPVSALLGGFLSGLLWEATGWMFASFVITSTNYTALYSTFATPILFLLWLEMGWLILLIGADISFYHQHPRLSKFHRQNVRLRHRNIELAGK